MVLKLDNGVNVVNMERILPPLPIKSPHYCLDAWYDEGPTTDAWNAWYDKRATTKDE